MHALLTIPAALRAEANARAAEKFPGAGEDSFAVPLFALSSLDDTTPTGYLSAPEFQSEETLDLAGQLIGAMPGATMDAYPLSDPFDLHAALFGHGYRTSGQSGFMKS